VELGKLSQEVGRLLVMMGGGLFVVVRRGLLLVGGGRGVNSLDAVAGPAMGEAGEDSRGSAVSLAVGEDHGEVVAVATVHAVIAALGVVVAFAGRHGETPLSLRSFPVTFMILL